MCVTMCTIHDIVQYYSSLYCTFAVHVYYRTVVCIVCVCYSVYYRIVVRTVHVCYNEYNYTYSICGLTMPIEVDSINECIQMANVLVLFSWDMA